MTDSSALCAAASHYSAFMSVRERELNPDGQGVVLLQGEGGGVPHDGEGLETHRILASAARGPQKTRVAPFKESRASQEALHIYTPLAVQLGMFRLKTKLEDGAFRTLYSRSHARV